MSDLDKAVENYLRSLDDATEHNLDNMQLEHPVIWLEKGTLNTAIVHGTPRYRADFVDEVMDHEGVTGVAHPVVDRRGRLAIRCYGDENLQPLLLGALRTGTLLR